LIAAQHAAAPTPQAIDVIAADAAAPRKELAGPRRLDNDKRSNHPIALMQARVAVSCRNQLGEGPVWLPAQQRLLWVDILGGLLYAWRPGTAAPDTRAFDRELSAAVPTVDGGLVLALGNSLATLADALCGHATVPLLSVEPEKPENRFNDCRCDPQGRLWAGTMSKARCTGDAALYRLQPGGDLRPMIPDTTISNGIGWSPDQERMYFIDSPTQRIDVLDFDGREGTVANRRCLARIDPADGMPDGLAVDAEGGIWVCLFGGGAIRRYGPDGAVEEHVALPVPHPTCPAFGGDDLSTLFITTTRHRLQADELSRYPDAGSLFAVDADVKGIAPHAFG
jgi:sugar lactone lactonase YvrE